MDIDASAVSLVDRLLDDAIAGQVSDIHFEPYEKNYRVRYRNDGLLFEVCETTLEVGRRLVSRLKILADLDITERRLPQDGRFHYQGANSNPVDFRISTLPTLHGEKIVLRLLDTVDTKLTLDTLGMTRTQLQDLLQTIHKPYGMVLVTGPTGSGKTLTLYAVLQTLNQPEVNISTVEDPVEIQLVGINQVPINPVIGLEFAQVLRALLRQDPDIIMVGEIRDLETAEIAIRAALTGHLVLSTLHTNDACQTLTRLASMGLPPYNIASAILLILAQRLVRLLCKHCKTPIHLPENMLRQAGFNENEIRQELLLYKAVGCEHCLNGYLGRSAIFEVMPISSHLEMLILNQGSTLELRTQAHNENIWSLRKAGLEKVKSGLTSLDELNRVTLSKTQLLTAQRR